jgi:hypothetical protein
LDFCQFNLFELLDINKVLDGLLFKPETWPNKRIFLPSSAMGREKLLQNINQQQQTAEKIVFLTETLNFMTSEIK